MPAGTRTFGIGETLLEPGVLPPPPTRHALLVFLITLAAILHLGTAGWSEIHNGAEGIYASAARDFIEATADAGSERDFTLLHWLTIGSCKIFGVNPAGARFPTAFAMIASVALTFLIGEKLFGYWRAFAAGLIHLCSLGSFLCARHVTPAPLFSVLLEAAIFCALCGYQRQQTRRFWFAATWACVALACMTVGIAGLLYPAAILLLSAPLFREARTRFAKIFHWTGIAIFIAVLAPWILWTRWQDAGFQFSLHPPEWPGVSLSHFLIANAAWWFPILFLVLPGTLVGWRKVFRPQEFEFRDALPLCWMAVGFIPLLFLPQRQDYDSIPMWSGFALWTATAWDRMPRAFRLAGIGFAAVAALTAAWLIAFPPASLMPGVESVGWHALLLLLGLTLGFAGSLAAYFAWRDRETLSIAVLMLGMVPVGLSAAEAMARFGPHFSFATAARFLEPRLGDEGEVLYEGSRFAGSSLPFYLEKQLLVIDGRELTPDFAMEKMAGAHPVYLIIQKERVPFWQERLTERFHIYHQESTCGSHVLISNQP